MSVFVGGEISEDIVPLIVDLRPGNVNKTQVVRSTALCFHVVNVF